MAKSADQRLVDAALFGTASQVAKVLRRGGTPDAVGEGGTTAVYVAAMRDGPAILRSEQTVVTSRMFEWVENSSPRTPREVLGVEVR